MAELLVVEVDPAARPSSAAVAPSPIAPPVDLDNVPKLYHLQSVQAPAKAPFPVSVVGSARTGQKALPSKDNFHFTLALKSQDAAHGILNMVAGAMQIFMAAFGREGDVAVVPFSNDRIFHQTGHTLKQGGTPSWRGSRADPARNLKRRRENERENERGGGGGERERRY